MTAGLKALHAAAVGAVHRGLLAPVAAVVDDADPIHLAAALGSLAAGLLRRPGRLRREGVS